MPVSTAIAPRTCTHSWHVEADGFPVCKGDACLGTTVACGQGSIDCPRHGASPVLAVAPAHPRDLVPGDVVTELDTPDGPWYVVLEVVADGLVVEGAEAGEPQSLPVPLEVAPTDRVLVRRAPIADPASDSAAHAIDPLEVTVAPSGRFGFYRPEANRWESEPVVAVAQAIVRGTGMEWHATPARYYERTILGIAPGADLSIDHGAGWTVGATDVAALKRFTFGVASPDADIDADGPSPADVARELSTPALVREFAAARVAIAQADHYDAAQHARLDVAVAELRRRGTLD